MLHILKYAHLVFFLISHMFIQVLHLEWYMKIWPNDDPIILQWAWLISKIISITNNQLSDTNFT